MNASLGGVVVDDDAGVLVLLWSLRLFLVFDCISSVLVLAGTVGSDFLSIRLMSISFFDDGMATFTNVFNGNVVRALFSSSVVAVVSGAGSCGEVSGGGCSFVGR